MDESTEKEITMEFETQTDNQAQYKSEESHATVKALEKKVQREQVPLSVEVASRMQKKMFQAARWFALQAHKGELGTSQQLWTHLIPRILQKYC